MSIKTFLGRVFSFKNAKTAALALGGIAVFLFAVSYGLSWYEQWKGRQGVENLAEMLKKIEAEDYKLAMADTYGGKTPQETLDLFIVAVEKGDFELASKYFIISEQKKWQDGLVKTRDTNKIDFFLGKIKEVKNNIQNGYYSEEKDWFRVEQPISIEFMRYPSGNWKIIEI